MDKNKYITELDKIGMMKRSRFFLQENTGAIKANNDIYGPKANDFKVLQRMNPEDTTNPSVKMETMEELEARDKKRKEDGFRSKLKILSRPVGDGNEFIQVPIVDESKLMHGQFEPNQDTDTGGSGDQEEGEVLGEKDIEDCDQERKAGDEPGEHGLDPETVKDIEGMIENAELPNLEEKGRRVPVDEYTYELGDVFRGRGQKLNKKKTEKNIIETNILLKRLDIDNPDPKKLVVSKSDMVFNIFSRIRMYKSQAKVFFCRDYSGSMHGVATKTVVDQHMMLYWWLMKMYGEKLVEPYFVLHDIDAKQVFNFRDYFYATVSGGTQVSSCFKLVNKIIKAENLAEEYNIFVFYGTDGDDWDNEGSSAVPKLKELLGYVNRAGIVIVKWDDGWISEERKKAPTIVEKYITDSGLLKTYQKVFRMFTMTTSQAGKKKNLEAVKTLIAK